MPHRKNELVVKANSLVEASYRLTLVEQRIILFAIAEARQTQRGLSSEDFITIRAVDYAKLFDIDECTAYQQIKDAAKTLFSRYVVFNDTHPESGKPRRTEVRWIAAASYIDDAGTIQLRFAPDIVPFISRLESNFTRYRLEKIANMTSAHAIRLYELLVQWGSVGKREIELNWLRTMLMLEDEYPAVFELKRRVIDVGVAQINAHSDLMVEYTQHKTGRNVTHINFEFSKKEEEKPAAKSKGKPVAKAKSNVEKGQSQLKAAEAASLAAFDKLVMDRIRTGGNSA